MAMEDATLIKRGNQSFVLRALASGDEYPLQGEMLVGREVECAIALNSGHISRYHAKINVSPNGVYIEDLHSTNGTFVNGQKIKGRVRLAVGDEVSFDDICFRLTSDSAGAAANTSLSPRRHLMPELAQQPPARPQPAAKPIRPSLVSARADSLQDIGRIDDLLNAAARAAAPPPAVAPVEVVSAAPAPAEFVADADDTAEDRTQMMSSIQLDRLVERGRMDQDIHVGSGPRLIVLTAPLRGKLFKLDDAALGTNWQIGRDLNAEICLNDKTISNDHARLAKVGEGYLLTATHAKNGILINGFAKSRVYLNHNDKIQIGRTELVFKTDENSPQTKTVSDRDSMPDGRMRRYSIAITVITLVVLVTALFATSR